MSGGVEWKPSGGGEGRLGESLNRLVGRVVCCQLTRKAKRGEQNSLSRRVLPSQRPRPFLVLVAAATISPSLQSRPHTQHPRSENLYVFCYLWVSPSTPCLVAHGGGVSAVCPPHHHHHRLRSHLAVLRARTHVQAMSRYLRTAARLRDVPVPRVVCEAARRLVTWGLVVHKRRWRFFPSFLFVSRACFLGVAWSRSSHTE